MSLKSLIVRVLGDKTQLDSTLKGAEGSVNRFSGVVKKLGGMIAAAFGVTAIVNFGKEAVKLAATAEGIRKGFEQLNAPGLLNELREATKGTVSDMQLMSRAVQASNFQIPLKDLAKLLEFASARAVQTGQSVDYLVDSIVLGIGRKSPLILDNLGISAVRLRQILKGAGVEMQTVGDVAAAVGQIATEELEKMGGIAETGGVKIQQLGAAWLNMKEKVGATIMETKAFQTIIQWLSDEAEIWGDDKLNFWQKMNGSPDDYKEWKKNQDEAQKQFIETTNKHFPGLIDGLKKVHDQTQENNRVEAESAERLRIQAEAAAEAAAAAKKLADARAKLGYSPGKSGNVLSPSVSSEGSSPSDIAQTQYFVQNYLNNSGSNKLRGGPKFDESKAAYNQMIEDMIEAQAALDDHMMEIENTLQNGRQMAIEMGAEFIGALGEAIGGGNMQDIGKNLLLSFAGFMATFGKMLITLGIGMKAFQESLTNLFSNPLLPIAAGAALIATAGIIRGSAQKAANSVQGNGGGYSAGGDLTVQSLKVQFEGVLKGKDIYFSGKRYVSELNSGT